MADKLKISTELNRGIATVEELSVGRTRQVFVKFFGILEFGICQNIRNIELSIELPRNILFTKQLRKTRTQCS